MPSKKKKKVLFISSAVKRKQLQEQKVVKEDIKVDKR